MINQTNTVSMLQAMMKDLGIEDGEKKEETLLNYMDLVLERNQKVNLTAITEPEEFIKKHYMDSLAAARLPEFREAETVIDLGTGAGFPGVPLAVCFPEKDFLLADSLNKRIGVIREFCAELGIDNVTAVHGRAEDLGRQDDLREHFDVCVSRAVADLSVLAEYCLPFVKVGGWFLSYKGPDCGQEVSEADHAISTLGGAVENIVNTGRDGHTDHKMVLIKKIESTPSTYPRRAGKPVKSPLRASK